jgi:hypothetical protein
MGTHEEQQVLGKPQHWHTHVRCHVPWLQIIAGEACRPQMANTWQTGFAVVLALFTAGSCLQLGLSSNISLLPAVRWMRLA